jgi:hypothetical protein
MPRFRFRSAVTGRWVKRLFAALSPRETVRERVRIANDPFGIHEALHTSHVLMDSYGDHVCDHPAVTERPDIADLADKAMHAMMEVYQAIGRLDD